MSRALALVMAAGLSALAGVAGAQSAPQPPTEPPAPAKTPMTEEEDRAALKARLERAIADLRQLQTRLEEGLTRLGRGESAKAVRDSVDIPRFRGPTGDQGRGRRPSGSTGPSGRQDNGHRGEDVTLEPAERDSVLKFITEHNPEFAERLRAMEKDNAAGFGRILGRMALRVREIQTEPDAPMRELRITEFRNNGETMNAWRKLTDAIRKGGSEQAPEAQQALANLKGLLGASFDVEVKIRNREIVMLEERIATIRKELSERLSERDAFVKTKSEQMLKGSKDRAAHPARQGDKPPGPAGGSGADANNKR